MAWLLMLHQNVQWGVSWIGPRRLPNGVWPLAGHKKQLAGPRVY